MARKWVKKRKEELGRVRKEYGAFKRRREQRKEKKLRKDITKLQKDIEKTKLVAELEEQRAKLRAAKGPSRLRRIGGATARQLAVMGERSRAHEYETETLPRHARRPRRGPAASVAPMPDMGMPDVMMGDVAMPAVLGSGQARRTTRRTKRRRRRQPGPFDALYY